MIRLSQSSHSKVNGRSATLIATLVCVVIGVAFLPERETNDFPEPPPRRPRPEITQASLHQTKLKLVRAQWPAITLEDALEANPFQVIFENDELQPTIENVADDSSESVLQTNSELRSLENVNIIFENAYGRVAMIGSRLVKVGDMLPEGQVVKITSDEVMVDVQSAVEIPEADPEQPVIVTEES